MRGDDPDRLAADGSVSFLSISTASGGDWIGSSVSDGSRNKRVVISRYSASASKVIIEIDMMSRLKVIELMGHCKSPAANLSMGLDIAVENDNVSAWIASTTNFSSQHLAGGTGNDTTDRIR